MAARVAGTRRRALLIAALAVLILLAGHGRALAELMPTDLEVITDRQDLQQASLDELADAFEAHRVAVLEGLQHLWIAGILICSLATAIVVLVAVKR